MVWVSNRTNVALIVAITSGGNPDNPFTIQPGALERWGRNMWPRTITEKLTTHVGAKLLTFDVNPHDLVIIYEDVYRVVPGVTYNRF